MNAIDHLIQSMNDALKEKNPTAFFEAFCQFLPLTAPQNFLHLIPMQGAMVCVAENCSVSDIKKSLLMVAHYVRAKTLFDENLETIFHKMDAKIQENGIQGYAYHLFERYAVSHHGSALHAYTIQRILGNLGKLMKTSESYGLTLLQIYNNEPDMDDKTRKMLVSKIINFSDYYASRKHAVSFRDSVCHSGMFFSVLKQIYMDPRTPKDQKNRAGHKILDFLPLVCQTNDVHFLHTYDVLRAKEARKDLKERAASHMLKQIKFFASQNFSLNVSMIAMGDIFDAIYWTIGKNEEITQDVSDILNMAKNEKEHFPMLLSKATGITEIEEMLQKSMKPEPSRPTKVGKLANPSAAQGRPS